MAKGPENLLVQTGRLVDVESLVLARWSKVSVPEKETPKHQLTQPVEKWQLRFRVAAIVAACSSRLIDVCVTRDRVERTRFRCSVPPHFELTYRWSPN